MKRAVVLVSFALASIGWAQSLGDVARANRERAKATKVITNDDLKTDTAANPSDVPGNLAQELDRMRHILQQICSDPRTDHGRKLSDYDKREIVDGVKPLRARVNEYEQLQKQYKKALADLDEKWESKLQEIWPKERPATEDDVQRVKALRQDYESDKQALVKRAESELRPYEELHKELEEIGEECPEAVKSVPD